jgi:hypothetical protein
MNYTRYLEICNRNYINSSMTKIAFGMKISFYKFKGLSKQVKKLDGRKENGFVLEASILEQELDKLS